jgi:cytoskeletal protein CcmA (bactofilin family)
MSDGGNGATNGKRTLVEEGTAITGTLASSCPIVVMGKVDGEISGPSMEIAETGVVCGRIKVTALSSRGELAGELDADTVQLGGRVRDETVIRARSLEVTSSAGTAVKFGECELSIGDEPNKQRAIDQATGVAHQRPAEVPLAAAPPPPAAAPAAESAPSERRRRRNSAAVSVPLDPTESGSVAGR